PLTIFCLPYFSYSQFTTGGVSLQGGVGYVSYHFEDYEPVQETYQNKPGFSFQLGTFANYNFSEHSGLEAELNALLQQGHSNITISGETVGSATATTRIAYIILPVRYTYAIHSYSIMGGLQMGLTIHDWESVDATFYKPDSMQFSNTSGGGLHTFDLGITLGVQKKICDRLFIT